MTPSSLAEDCGGLRPGAVANRLDLTLLILKQLAAKVVGHALEKHSGGSNGLPVILCG
jgi:hypothetical protein